MRNLFLSNIFKISFKFKTGVVQKSRGSLPDLRQECSCPCSHRPCSGKNLFHCIHRYSSGSTDSLLEEVDEFLRKSDENYPIENTTNSKRVSRRCSENDIQRGRQFYPYRILHGCFSYCLEEPCTLKIIQPLIKMGHFVHRLI